MTNPSLPSLLIVTGLPCSGKTTLARKLAFSLSLPLVTKDDIKERLFNSLGWSDRQWSRKIGLATYDILFYIIETHLAGHHSLIAESNFPPASAAKNFNRIRSKYPFNLLALECIARSNILEARWRRRAERSTRHPGHNDASALDEFIQTIRDHTSPDGYGRLGIPEGAVSLGVVDTSSKPKNIPAVLELYQKLTSQNEITTRPFGGEP